MTPLFEIPCNTSTGIQYRARVIFAIMLLHPKRCRRRQGFLHAVQACASLHQFPELQKFDAVTPLTAGPSVPAVISVPTEIEAYRNYLDPSLPSQAITDRLVNMSMPPHKVFPERNRDVRRLVKACLKKLSDDDPQRSATVLEPILLKRTKLLKKTGAGVCYLPFQGMNLSLQPDDFLNAKYNVMSKVIFSRFTSPGLHKTPQTTQDRSLVDVFAVSGDQHKMSCLMGVVVDGHYPAFDVIENNAWDYVVQNIQAQLISRLQLVLSQTYTMDKDFDRDLATQLRLMFLQLDSETTDRHGGATCTLALLYVHPISGALTLTTANVGDSPCYLVTPNKVAVMTAKHSAGDVLETARLNDQFSTYNRGPTVYIANDKGEMVNLSRALGDWSLKLPAALQGMKVAMPGGVLGYPHITTTTVQDTDCWVIIIGSDGMLDDQASPRTANPEMVGRIVHDPFTPLANIGLKVSDMTRRGMQHDDQTLLVLASHILKPE